MNTKCYTSFKVDYDYEKILYENMNKNNYCILKLLYDLRAFVYVYMYLFIIYNTWTKSFEFNFHSFENSTINQNLKYHFK